MRTFIKELVAPDPLEWAFGDEVYHRVLAHTDQDELHAQVYTLLNQSRRLETTPDFFRAQLKEKYEETLFLNFFIKNQTDALLQYCESNRIEVMPLKGVYFAEKVFGHFGARSTSDIDLLIHKEDLEKVKAGIRKQGFVEDEPEIDDHFHVSFSKRLPWTDMPLTVELHWNIVKEDTTHLNAMELWLSAHPFCHYHYVMELDDRHLFYFMVLHGWRHNLDSYRHYLDIVQVIMQLHESIDYSQLMWDAKRHGTLRRVIRTLSMVYAEFPFLDHVKPFPFKRKRGHRLHGKEDASRAKVTWGQYADFIDYHLTSYDEWGQGARALVDWFKEEKLAKKAP